MKQTGRRHIITRICLLLSAAAWQAGCSNAIVFPAHHMESTVLGTNTRAYDTSKDGRADFFTYLDDTGRIGRIGYDRSGDEKADFLIALDDLPISHCRHVVIIIDGFAYDVVRRYYDDGGLRAFYPPSLVIAPYPAMTDLGIADLLGDYTCMAIQVKYYSRARNQGVGSVTDYLRFRNEHYARFLTYRAAKRWDGIAYFNARPVFRKEMSDLKRHFDKYRGQEIIAYIISSAGVSTQKGEQGQIEALELIDRFVHQLIWETHGHVKITIMSDHGHSYTPPKRNNLKGFLRERGWRPTDKLRHDHDVYVEELGLITTASLWTRHPAELVSDLIESEGVMLASYSQQDAVVVLSPDGGRAVIRRRNAAYSYEKVEGDPLLLTDILSELTSDNGFYDSRELLYATARHIYPDPLHRLWRAHFAQVQNPPTVLLSFDDGYCAGSGFFFNLVGIASTHGSLNYTNTAAFIMSTAAPLPPVMRSRDVPGAMSDMVGEPWPVRR